MKELSVDLEVIIINLISLIPMSIWPYNDGRTVVASTCCCCLDNVILTFTLTLTLTLTLALALTLTIALVITLVVIALAVPLAVAVAPAVAPSAARAAGGEHAATAAAHVDAATIGAPALPFDARRTTQRALQAYAAVVGRAEPFAAIV